MKGYDYFSLFLNMLCYPMYSQQKIKSRQEKMLAGVVSFAKKHSPYLSQLYSDTGDNVTLEKLPVINKKMMMENFDSYVTDRNVKLKDVYRFMETPENLSEDYLGKYFAATTSGSTGVPAVVLHDEASRKTAALLSVFRYMKLAFPLAAFCVDDVFLIENGNIRHNQKKMPMLKNKIRLIDAKKTYDEITEEFNVLQPKVIVGYTGSIEMLADQAIAGKLSISPKQVLTSGEYLSPKTREKLKKAFKCEIKAIYGCTEGNVIAAECKCGHMHVNSDFYIIEAVDNDNRPVPCGQISDKILLTNLCNFVQPIIRFEITDRVIMHNDGCPCGKKGMWFEVEGRSNDILVMDAENGKTGISPIPLTFVAEPLSGINNFQLILHPKNTIELRLDVLAGCCAKEVFENAKTKLTEYLCRFGVTKAEIYLSPLPPQRSKRTGKFRQIYQTDEPYEYKKTTE